MAKSDAPTGGTNYAEITLSDGTVSRWAIPDDETADRVIAAVVAIAGEPDTTLT